MDDNRGHRHQVEMPAILIAADGAEQSTRIRNLSLGGCCVETELEIGRTLQVATARIGRLTAEVRWSFAGRSGLRFHSSVAA